MPAAVALRCPFCDARIRLEPLSIWHDNPVCEDFDRMSPARFLRAIRRAQPPLPKAPKPEPPGGKPRPVTIRLAPEELEVFDQVAAKLGSTRTPTILRAIELGRELLLENTAAERAARRNRQK